MRSHSLQHCTPHPSCSTDSSPLPSHRIASHRIASVPLPHHPQAPPATAPAPAPTLPSLSALARKQQPQPKQSRLRLKSQLLAPLLFSRKDQRPRASCVALVISHARGRGRIADGGKRVRDLAVAVTVAVFVGLEERRRVERREEGLRGHVDVDVCDRARGEAGWGGWG